LSGSEQRARGFHSRRPHVAADRCGTNRFVGQAKVARQTDGIRGCGTGTLGQRPRHVGRDPDSGCAEIDARVVHFHASPIPA